MASSPGSRIATVQTRIRVARPTGPSRKEASLAAQREHQRPDRRAGRRAGLPLQRRRFRRRRPREAGRIWSRRETGPKLPGARRRSGCARTRRARARASGTDRPDSPSAARAATLPVGAPADRVDLLAALADLRAVRRAPSGSSAASLAGTSARAAGSSPTSSARVRASSGESASRVAARVVGEQHLPAVSLEQEELVGEHRQVVVVGDASRPARTRSRCRRSAAARRARRPRSRGSRSRPSRRVARADHCRMTNAAPWRPVTCERRRAGDAPAACPASG